MYDPAQARIEAESVKGCMEKFNASDDNVFKTRAVVIKEERADLVKHHLWVLWTDYFTPAHLEQYPAAARAVLERHQGRRGGQEDHRHRGRRQPPGPDRRDRQDLLGDQEVDGPGRGRATRRRLAAARRVGGGMPWSGTNQMRSRAGQMARVTGRHLERTLGGQERTRVILALAAILALSSADAATVGAAASPLRSALHISNTDIGLLVTVSSLVAAVASLPFGVMADRLRRTRILGLAVATWGAAMLWSATVSTFGGLVLARVVLGAVTAAAGPMVASLVGDYFEGSERGRIYSYILTGELVGAGIGFAVTGDIAALSWRAAFVLLALPAFFLAWYVLQLPEPARGGLAPLRPATGRDGGPDTARPEPTPGGDAG